MSDTKTVTKVRPLILDLIIPSEDMVYEYKQ